jgi:hypothetical protein
MTLEILTYATTAVLCLTPGLIAWRLLRRRGEGLGPEQRLERAEDLARRCEVVTDLLPGLRSEALRLRSEGDLEGALQCEAALEALEQVARERSDERLRLLRSLGGAPSRLPRTDTIRSDADESREGAA